jgi:hypothetical protein
MYWASFNKVFLNDAFQECRRNGVVPDSFRINDGYRSLVADPQAVCFGAIDRSVRSSQAKLFEPAL